MNLLVVGGGGREHAMAWKLAQSPRADRVFVAPGNAGTAIDAENVDIAADDIPALGFQSGHLTRQGHGRRRFDAVEGR